MGHLLIAAPRKSSGKTTVTLGLCAALRAQGSAVQPFKKGPDYIDPMWLGRATARPCYNLDYHTMSEEEIHHLFARAMVGADIGIIEGNMGMFDSTDPAGRTSNGSLAALLGAPVALLVNVEGMNRSIAPLVLGFQHFDPTVRIGGVILNNIAGRRHEGKLREAIAQHTDLPVLGAIQRNPELAIDERHLGLIPSNEAAQADTQIAKICSIMGDSLDLAAIRQLANQAAPPPLLPPPVPQGAPGQPVRIGIARDAAFGFYYPDDLDALTAAGAELVPFDTLRESTLPTVDGLFIGGGFPETHMAQLSANTALRSAIFNAIEGGMPAYAECGGLMYLARAIQWQGERHEMVGIVPGEIVMQRRPVGRGYVRLRGGEHHPWHPEGLPVTEFNAHEFHYSSLEGLPADTPFAYHMVRGHGIDGQHDGFIHRRLLANYTHLRSVGGYHWATAFVDFVRRSCRTP